MCRLIRTLVSHPLPLYVVQVISVSSLKGGVGKTTVTLGLASAAFARHLRTLVVDMDPQCDATTGLGVDFNGVESIADILRGPRSAIVERVIRSSQWTHERNDVVDVIPGSPHAVNFDEPHPKAKDIWKLEEALASVESHYDVVIIDCPPSLNALTQTAWTASDRVLIVSEPGLFSVAAAARALRAISDANDERKDGNLRPAGIVINRFRPQSIEHQYRVSEIREMFGDQVLDIQLPERSSLQQSQGAAKPVHSWPGDATQDLSELFDQLLDTVLTT